MYFSTTPPYWRMIRRTVEMKAVCCWRTVSGSARSANGVDPIASMNKTLTRRRSSCPTGSGRSDVPQPVQKLSSAALARLHRGQATVMAVPHLPQNRSSGPAGRPQLVQAVLAMAGLRGDGVSGDGRMVARQTTQVSGCRLGLVADRAAAPARVR
jgi:hypothetical protein